MKLYKYIFISLLFFGQKGFTQVNPIPLPSTGPSSPLQQQQYATQAATTWYVASAGNDSNDCLSSGTSCLTIQAAINKIPKLLRHQATVSISAGTYAGFIVSGFSADNGVQQTTGGLLIDGVLANSTLATGSPTGTAAGAGQLAGSGSTFGVICDSGATWTVNDLTGRFITTTLPTNASLVVSSNTATCITVVGTWSLPVAAQTTYTIQDPSVIVSTAVNRPPPPDLGGAAIARAGVMAIGNHWGRGVDYFVLRNIRVANATGPLGVDVSGSGLKLSQVQIRPALTGATGVVAGTPFFGLLTISSADVLVTSGNAVAMTSGSGGTGLFNNSLFRTTLDTTGKQGLGTSTKAFVGSLTSCEFRAFNFPVVLGGCALAVVSNGSSNYSGNRVACADGSGVAIVVGVSDEDDATGSWCPTAIGPISTTDIQTCGTALRVLGASVADVASMSGSVGSTGFDIRTNSLISYTKAGMTLTAGTNEINLDNGRLTANFADPTAGNCLSVTDTGSKACAR